MAASLLCVSLLHRRPVVAATTSYSWRLIVCMLISMLFYCLCLLKMPAFSHVNVILYVDFELMLDEVFFGCGFESMLACYENHVFWSQRRDNRWHEARDRERRTAVWPSTGPMGISCRRQSAHGSTVKHIEVSTIDIRSTKITIYRPFSTSASLKHKNRHI